MTRLSLTKEIKNFALETGLDLIGITSAEPFLEAAERIKHQITRGLRSSRWKITKIDNFCNPKNFLADAKSVIVAAECYLSNQEAFPANPQEPYGTIARYTWRNYYYDVKSKLKRVAEFLKLKTGSEFHFRVFSNGPLAEKPLAPRAGIGWYGKHGIIVTPKYGSWVVLGELLTNLELSPDKPLENSCAKCKACIDACPTGAIVEPYILDPSKCLQHLSNQPVVLPQALREIWGNRLYGCTSCQEACPQNQKVKAQNHKPEHGYVGAALPLIPILQMNESEYFNMVAGNQMAESWINFEAIQRNAALALGNLQDPAAIPVLTQTLENNPSPLVKIHADWALKKIAGRKAK